MNKLTIGIPDSYPSKWKEFYENKKVLTLPDQTIFEIKNCFLSHEGIPLKRFQIPKHSLVNLRGNEDIVFNKEFRKLAMEQYLVSHFGKSLKLIKESKTLAFCYGKWFNYFFWVTEFIPKILRLRMVDKNTPIIYPESWSNISYVNESLNLINEDNFYLLEKGAHLQLKQLKIPSSRPYSNVFYPENIQLLRETFIGDYSSEGKRKIYATRKTADRRSLLNEHELIPLLEKYNYEIIDFSDLTFIQQIEMMRDADSFISMHGAGLTNMIWMKPDSNIIELNYAVPNVDPRISYWRLAKVCNYNYHILFGTPKKNRGTSEYDHDILVNLEEVENTLKSLC